MLGRMMWVAAAIATCGFIGPVRRAEAAPRKKLLVVTHTEGFRHTEGIAAGEVVIKEIGEKSGVFSVDYCRNADDVRKMLTPEYLKPYDGVVFLNTTGELPIPDVQAFLDWVKSGKAFLGFHSATDTFHPNAGYIEMIGGEFQTHGAQCAITPIVEDPKHPATARWPKGLAVTDEIYHHVKVDRTKCRVLLRLDANPADNRPEQNQPADFWVAWCRSYGKGRVFYSLFGHRKDVWDVEAFREQILGAVRWTTGLARGDASPRPRPAH